ncbi:MAG: DUF177 domain-containing protein, partial [Cyanobacteria bacterium REEB65]|nr:DUF177 domain-containing protein [Cyanobacteria bacterium REEB65]
AFRETVEVPPDVGSLTEPVVGGFLVEVTGGQPFLSLKGDFRAHLELLCHRCGNPFGHDLDFEVNEALEVVAECPASEEVGETVWEKGNLDVGDLVRQILLLALPSQVLCGCTPAPSPDSTSPDPRWQGLSDVRRHLKEEL